MPPSKSNEENKEIFNWKSFLIWVILAVLLRWQVIEPRWIPSGSMLPTLRIQDKILVEKIRPRLKKTLKKHLNYGSLVVFAPPKELVYYGYDQNAALIKRIVGLPGDEIKVFDGALFRNNQLIQEPWIEEKIDYEMETVTIQEDEIWVLGDNRNNSLDSHIWGALPEENIIGTAIWRYWPMKRFGAIRFPTQKRIGA
tara:strand:- start:1053 stop:1643 length:591 start_codon:yes stop_codon:yes gene_type:complete